MDKEPVQAVKLHFLAFHLGMKGWNMDNITRHQRTITALQTHICSWKTVSFLLQQRWSGSAFWWRESGYVLHFPMYSHVHLQAAHQMLIILAFLKFDPKCWQCCTRILKFSGVVGLGGDGAESVQTAAPLLQIEDYDVVASMLAARSSFLCSLDLWRCRNLTDRGLVELVNGCRWLFCYF